MSSSGFFTIPTGHRAKLKEKQRDRKIIGSCRRAEKSCGTWKVSVIPIAAGAPGMSPSPELGENTEEIGDQKKNREHFDHRTEKIS